MDEPPPKPPVGGRPPADRTLSRVLGIAGVVGLFVVLIVMVSLIGGSGGDDASEEAVVTPAVTPTPTPTRTPKPEKTPVPLTPEQKLDRQDDLDVVSSRGFDVVDKHDWNPDDTLQVLIGKGSSGGYLAFFFVDGQYLGNDSTELSAKLKIKRTNDLDVTLAYGIYQPGDDPLKPTGDPVLVHFRYEGGQVAPVEAIPAPEQRTPGRFTG
jgi:hypothetical protein